jgi:hypothetical protein
MNNIPNAVARNGLKPSMPLRPRAPGQFSRDAHAHLAGRVLIHETVASNRMKSFKGLRPRAPGLSIFGTQAADAGRALFHKESDR